MPYTQSSTFILLPINVTVSSKSLPIHTHSSIRRGLISISMGTWHYSNGKYYRSVLYISKVSIWWYIWHVFRCASSLLEIRCQNRYTCVCWNKSATAGTNRDVSCHITYQYFTESWISILLKRACLHWWESFFWIFLVGLFMYISLIKLFFNDFTLK